MGRVRQYKYICRLQKLRDLIIRPVTKHKYVFKRTYLFSETRNILFVPADKNKMNLKFEI